MTQIKSHIFNKKTLYQRDSLWHPYSKDPGFQLTPMKTDLRQYKTTAVAIS